MRIEPISDSQHNIERDIRIAKFTRKITRTVALIVSAAVTFGLFIKILFF